jgi:hypothetical protein
MLALHVPQAHIIAAGSIMRASAHHLPDRANIIQKSVICRQITLF